MKLYSYWRSSSSWRVRIALAYKGIDYEYVPVNILPRADEQSTEAFDTVNPMHQVPVLEVTQSRAPQAAGPTESRAPQAAGPTESPAPQAAGPDTGVARISQSMAILEYLEEQFPKPPLLPAGPSDRARVRQLAEMVNSGIQPLQNLYVQRHVKHTFGADGPAFARHFITRGLAALERAAGETAGRFLFGDAVSFADVYLVPQLFAARRVDVDVRPFATLLRVEAQCETHPAFVAAHPDRQPDARPDPPKS